MGWFTWKRDGEQPVKSEIGDSGNGELVEDNIPISKEKFILETRPADDNPELPIYSIYQRFQEDWETKGYKDATEFPETSYRENQKRVIVDKLRLAIKEALLRYEDKVTEIDSHINRAEKNGLIETLERYQAERKKLITHHDELSILDKDAQEIGEKTKPILISYDMGFTRGMVALSNEKVSEIMSKSNYE